jgi:hypothetical protein
MRTRVAIHGRDRNAMLDLVRRFHVDVVVPTARSQRDGQYHVDAVVDEATIAELERAGYAVRVLEDAQAHAAARRAEIDWHSADRPGQRPRITTIEGAPPHRSPPQQNG